MSQSRKVEKNKFGACLMKEPNLVADCLSKMQSVTKLPVTIKTRIGYDDMLRTMKTYIILFQLLKSVLALKLLLYTQEKQFLGKFTPKQNLNIPPLKYDYRL